MAKTLTIPPSLQLCNHYICLDVSSVNVGWALRKGRTVSHISTGTLRLPAKTPIGQRVAALTDWLLTMTREGGSQFIVYEAPVKKFYNSFVAQVRVQVALLLVSYKLSLPIFEVSPSQWKKTLTGKGDASKPVTMIAAARWLNLIDPIVFDFELLAETSPEGEFLSYRGTRLIDEHATAAVGISRTVEHLQAVRAYPAPKKRTPRKRKATTLSDEA